VTHPDDRALDGTTMQQTVMPSFDAWAIAKATSGPCWHLSTASISPLDQGQSCCWAVIDQPA